MKPTYQINKILSLVLSLLLMAVSALPLAAQEVAPQSKPGDLDFSFGSGGKTNESFMVGTVVAIQKDNKIVVGGFGDVSLARFNADGTLDMSFGNGGKANEVLSTINTVAIQPDGKILVAGYTSTGGESDFGLARYNVDGTPDNSFGNGGMVSTEFFGLNDEVKAIAIQTDGRIVVGGYARTSQSTTDFALARYSAAGVPDPTFGIGGRANTDMSGGFEDIRALAIQADGRIIAAGAVNSRTVCMRYNANGTPDGSFGVGGRVNILPNASNTPTGMAIQPDGKILVGGGAVNGQFDFMLLRLLPNGTPDPAFGNGGLVFTDFNGASDSGNSLILLKDGRILQAGEANVTPVNDSENHDFALACYKSDGTLDPTFGNGGKITTDFFNNEDEAYGAALQSNGRLILVGRTVKGNHRLGMAGYLLNIAANDNNPVIDSVKVKGKKLLVTGTGFEAPSFVYLNGERQKKSANDETSPTTVVIGLKAGKLIAPGQTVTVQVMNASTNKISAEFIFTRPLE